MWRSKYGYNPAVIWMTILESRQQLAPKSVNTGRKTFCQNTPFTNGRLRNGVWMACGYRVAVAWDCKRPVSSSSKCLAFLTLLFHTGVAQGQLMKTANHHFPHFLLFHLLGCGRGETWGAEVSGPGVVSWVNPLASPVSSSVRYTSLSARFPGPAKKHSEQNMSRLSIHPDMPTTVGISSW